MLTVSAILRNPLAGHFGGRGGGLQKSFARNVRRGGAHVLAPAGYSKKIGIFFSLRVLTLDSPSWSSG
jgi:hypothetical protein